MQRNLGGLKKSLCFPAGFWQARSVPERFSQSSELILQHHLVLQGRLHLELSRTAPHPELGADRTRLLTFLNIGALQNEHFVLHKDAEQGAHPIGHPNDAPGACSVLQAGSGAVMDGALSGGDKQIDSEACPGAGGATSQLWPQSLAGTLIKFICTSENNWSLAGS